MEFLAIMGIGTLVAIWIVVNLPKSRNARREIVSFETKPSPTPSWHMNISEVSSIDGADYLRKLDRHQNDPHHWPAPLPPQQPPKNY